MSWTLFSALLTLLGSDDLNSIFSYIGVAGVAHVGGGSAAQL